MQVISQHSNRSQMSVNSTLSVLAFGMELEGSVKKECIPSVTMCFYMLYYGQ